MADGVKYDDGKLEWDLLPYEELEQVVAILTFGAKKYSPDNWKKVPDAQRRYFNAMMRHIIAWKCGEEIDPESGKSHLAHAICNAMFLMWFDGNAKPVPASVSDIQDILNLDKLRGVRIGDDPNKIPETYCSPDGVVMEPVELTTDPKNE